MLAYFKKKESTNFQWDKLALNWGMLLALFIISFIRGNGREPSIIGVERCTGVDWVLFWLLVAIGALFTVVGVKITLKEYK